MCVQLNEEGVVLTLKDERIIDTETGDVNMAEDELENVDLVEKAKAKVSCLLSHLDFIIISFCDLNRETMSFVPNVR